MAKRESYTQQQRDLTLNNGAVFPLLGLGTCKVNITCKRPRGAFRSLCRCGARVQCSDASALAQVRGTTAVQVVKDAIHCGYRHIDTASVYKNEAAVGAGIHARIADGSVTREDVFISSKLWCTDTQPEKVTAALKKSLSEFGLEYLDCYLMNWPFSLKEGAENVPVGSRGEVLGVDVDYVQTWKEMEQCQTQGLAKSIGVCNFNGEQITRLLSFAKIKPVTNQIECHPFLNQKPFIAFCRKQDIVVTAHTPLGNPDNQIKNKKPTLLSQPMLKDIATKYKKSRAQIILRYLVQLGVNPIPGASNEKHLKENIDIFNFNLKQEDVTQIDDLNDNYRTVLFDG